MHRFLYLTLVLFLVCNSSMYSGRRRCGQRVAVHRKQGNKQQYNALYKKITSAISAGRNLIVTATPQNAHQALQRVVELRQQSEGNVRQLQQGGWGDTAQYLFRSLQDTIGDRMLNGLRQKIQQAKAEQSRIQTAAQSAAVAACAGEVAQDVGSVQDTDNGSNSVLDRNSALLKEILEKKEQITQKGLKRRTSQAVHVSGKKDSNEALGILAESLQRSIEKHWNNTVALKALFEVVCQRSDYATQASILENRIKKLEEQERGRIHEASRVIPISQRPVTREESLEEVQIESEQSHSSQSIGGAVLSVGSPCPPPDAPSILQSSSFPSRLMNITSDLFEEIARRRSIIMPQDQQDKEDEDEQEWKD